MKKLSEFTRNKYKVLFSDLDGTLITTKSGNTFPIDSSDYIFKDDAINSIINLAPEYLLIVTNQGGIGKFISKSEFENKLANIVSYLELTTGIKVVDALYCDSINKENEFRKPNVGMLAEFSKKYGLTDKKDMLMIGDASGLEGQFSNSDKTTAINFNIDYLDINEFIKTYK